MHPRLPALGLRWRISKELCAPLLQHYHTFYTLATNVMLIQVCV